MDTAQSQRPNYQNCCYEHGHHNDIMALSYHCFEIYNRVIVKNQKYWEISKKRISSVDEEEVLVLILLLVW